MAAATDRIESANVISVKKFKEQFTKILNPEDFGRKDSDAAEQYLPEEMDVSLATLKELSEVCW